jgi:OOP family OmpA-OmpF porin
MKIRNLLLTSTAALALCAVGQAQADPLYISVTGGANWMRDFSAHVTQCCSDGTVSENTDTGFMLSGAVGVHLDRWLHGLRAELEASYRRNRVKGGWSSTDDGESGTFAGHMSTFAVTANLWYDIDVGSKVRPYIGGGAGWGRRTVDFQATDTDDVLFNTTNGSFVHVEKSGFVYQLGAGMNYEIMADVDIGLGYRFFHAQDIHGYLSIDEAGTGPVKMSGDNHTVLLSLTIGID